MKNALKYSFKHTIPIMISFFPVGIAFGILMNSIGYGAFMTFLSSILIISGSLQFLSVTFLTTPTPFITILFMGFMISFKHIFYGISFIDKFKKFGLWKYFLIYTLCDENYSLFCSFDFDDSVNEKWAHIFTASFTIGYWFVYTVLGVILGSFIKFNIEGIDFALTALFTVIVVGQLQEKKSKLPAVIALFSSVLSILIFGANNFILPGLILIVILLIVFKNKISEEEYGSI